MFLKSLKIENGSTVVRNILFHKGINLIVDETETSDKKESGNNVGKTTVIRLIDYCLGGKGENIYKDTEFVQNTNTEVEDFLKQNNIIITLSLVDDLDNPLTEICIRRNFLSRNDKIIEINGESYKEKDALTKELKKRIFNSEEDKPTFRQIISKNIRDEKNRLQNTLKVLHATTTKDQYEPLFLFWLGIELNTNTYKDKLNRDRKTEENLQTRLRKEGTLSMIEQSLLVIERSIQELITEKETFNINPLFEKDLSELNQVKFDLNRYSTELSRLEMRKELILESKNELESEKANVNVAQILNLYNEAKALIPNLQKSFEDTLQFHNQMIDEKLEYIVRELPDLDKSIAAVKREISLLLAKEKNLTAQLKKNGATDDLQKIIIELNSEFEKKGKNEELKRLWEQSIKSVAEIDQKLSQINENLNSKDELIQQRVAKFNEYFSNVTYKLYGEREILSADPTDKGYEFKITPVAGNPGTGKKKGQIAAFDLAYIQFADSLNIRCLHFILNDQIENIHDNQIENLLTEIVLETNCQYILPVLRDKLPDDIEVAQYEVLTLSQHDKLFRI
ncbi:MAG: DUF2326 domain-containing protein [Bacteroides oleiciplenus]|nr:DUF2326 domain-containing protein [Bacteroides oleiciplenus]